MSDVLWQRIARDLYEAAKPYRDQAAPHEDVFNAEDLQNFDKLSAALYKFEVAARRVKTDCWAVMWLDHADIVGTYDDWPAAHDALVGFLADHPECHREIDVVWIDERGVPATRPNLRVSDLGGEPDPGELF